MSDLFESVGCPVCGRTPNDDCTRVHLPYAEEDLIAEREKLERATKRIEAYRNAIEAYGKTVTKP